MTVIKELLVSEIKLKLFNILNWQQHFDGFNYIPFLALQRCTFKTQYHHLNGQIQAYQSKLPLLFVRKLRPPTPQPQKWAVRILLECFLVYYLFQKWRSTKATSSDNNPFK